MAGYAPQWTTGYTSTLQTSEFNTPLYECYIESWLDFMPVETESNHQYCGNSGSTYVRTLGYVASANDTGVLVPIYRCSDAANHNQFISSHPACEGKTVDYRLGYIFPSAH